MKDRSAKPRRLFCSAVCSSTTLPAKPAVNGSELRNQVQWYPAGWLIFYDGLAEMDLEL